MKTEKFRHKLRQKRKESRREGDNHSIWIEFRERKKTTMPGHAEVVRIMARNIPTHMGVKI